MMYICIESRDRGPTAPFFVPLRPKTTWATVISVAQVVISVAQVIISVAQTVISIAQIVISVAQIVREMLTHS